MISDELRLKLKLDKNGSKVGQIEILEKKLANVEVLLLEMQARVVANPR